MPQPAKSWALPWGERKGLRPVRDGGTVCPVVWRPVAVAGLAACARPEPFMTPPRSVADVLSGHVSFELESIDRLYCNLYVPQLHRG